MLYHSVKFMCETVTDVLAAEIEVQAPGNLSAVGGSINKFLRVITDLSSSPQKPTKWENLLYLNFICAGKLWLSFLDINKSSISTIFLSHV